LIALKKPLFKSGFLFLTGFFTISWSDTRSAQHYPLLIFQVVLQHLQLLFREMLSLLEEFVQNRKFLTATGNIELRTYPILFKDDLNIQLKVNYNSKLTIEMFDLNGRLVKQENNHFVKIGVNTYSLSVGNLSPNMYMVVLEMDKEKLIKKVISKK